MGVRFGFNLGEGLGMNYFRERGIVFNGSNVSQGFGLDLVMVPLCSVHKAPSNEPNFILFAWLSPKLTNLSMLFILDRRCIANSAGEH